jgi:hypothetical protein
MANSDIIKIGFDYRASLAQFEKDTNGVFDGISNKAGKQKITIQLDAKDDKVIDKIKELQKLKLDKFTFEFGNSGLKEQLQTFDKLENKINEIINIGKGKSFINTSSTVTDIGKIENKINELNKKYEETQKKLSSISSGNISGKDVNLVDNAEFQKLSESLEKIKSEVDNLRTHMSLLDDSVVSGERFIKLGEQVDGLSVKFDGLIDKYHELSNAQKSLSSTTQVESNTSSGTKDAFQSGTTTASIEQQNKLQEEINETTNKFNNAKNSSKQELGDQDLQVLLSQQVSQYNQLIAKAEKYGDATSNVVQELKKERDIIASMNSDNIYVPKSGLTSDDYLRARDKYEINKAAFDSYETDIKKFEEEWTKLVEIDNAISNTQTLLNSLKVPSGFEGSFNNVKSTVESLNKDLENEQITLTEYNSQVKSAFNGFNNSVGEKQTQVWNELNNSLNRYATLQKRIASGNAFSTDEKEASDLLNKIYELQRSDILSTENLNHSNERLTQIRQTVEDIKKSVKENTLDSMQSVIDKYQKVFDQRSITPADFNQSDTYKKALGELSSSIKTLEEYKASLSGIDEITDEQKVHIEQLTMECEKCANAFKAMDSSEKGSNEASRYKEVDKLSKYLKENTRLSKEAKQQLEEYLNQLKSGDPNVNVKEIHTEWLKIAEAERMAGREGKSFLDILSTKSVHGFIGQLQSYLSMYVGFYGIVNKIRSTISTVTELDTSLVDLKKTTTMNASELESFYFDSNKVAKQMGVTTKEIIEQASAWSRLDKIGLLYGDI